MDVVPEVVPTFVMSAALVIALYEAGCFVQEDRLGIFFIGFEIHLPYPDSMPDWWDWSPDQPQGCYVLTFTEYDATEYDAMSLCASRGSL